MISDPAGTFGLDFPLPWQTSFADLGDEFFADVAPSALPSPYWVGTSPAVAHQLGLPAAWHESPELLQALTGNQRLVGTRPLASVYSGHQFGQWAGQLGDGRAILLGELAGHEVQLKGAGRTPFSRMGDGRAVLRSSIREFLASEAMAALGIASTRALCLTGSDAPVQRETTETAAVVTRVAPSFVRFGHFEHFSYTGQHDALQRLADAVIDRYYPACRTAQTLAANPYAHLLQAVSQRTAQLVARWQSVGFCHGVMNTDNMSILGLTMDYGPFQFLDAYAPGHICNHSDTAGRYAFNKQPQIAYWNLYALGQALLPLMGEQDLAVAALESYKTEFPAAFESAMRAKLGLTQASAGDREVIERLLKLLAQGGVDYPIFWRRLSQWVAGAALAPVRDMFLDGAGFDAWLLQYSELTTHIPRGLQADLMLNTNPKYVLRNHLGEEAIRAAKLKDFSVLHRLQSLLETPFDEHPGFEAYADFPPDWAAQIEISCSS
jgi:serine/tyrosine/threonine adenylyltransferase